jgi:cell division septation protein DedD
MDRVAYIIKELLAREGKALLPGLGVLTLQRDASQIDAAEGKINPPADSLHFLPSDYILEEHLYAQVQKLPLPPKVKEEHLAAEIAEFLRVALEGDEFSIGDFAHFKKIKPEGFAFKAGAIDEISPLGKLPVLKLPSHSISEVATSAAAVKAVDVSTGEEGKEEEEEKKSAWLLPALLTLLILILSFAVWWFTPDLRNGGEGFSKLLVKEERVNISPSEMEENDRTQKRAKSDSPQLDKDVLMAEDTLVHSSKTTDSPNTNITEPEKNETPEPPQEELNEDCVIVVGAFSKANNVSRMKQRLKDEGYDVFTQNANGLTRVGLYTSCMNEKLDSVLRVARREIEDAAWILE